MFNLQNVCAKLLSVLNLRFFGVCESKVNYELLVDILVSIYWSFKGASVSTFFQFYLEGM